MGANYSGSPQGSGRYSLPFSEWGKAEKPSAKKKKMAKKMIYEGAHKLAQHIKGVSAEKSLKKEAKNEKERIAERDREYDKYFRKGGENR